MVLVNEGAPHAITTLIFTYLSNLKWLSNRSVNWLSSPRQYAPCNFPKKYHYQFSIVIKNYTRFEALTAVCLGFTKSGTWLWVAGQFSMFRKKAVPSPSKRQTVKKNGHHWIETELLTRCRAELQQAEDDVLIPVYRRRKVRELRSLTSLTRRVSDMGARRWKPSSQKWTIRNTLKYKLYATR